MVEGVERKIEEVETAAYGKQKAPTEKEYGAILSDKIESYQSYLGVAHGCCSDLSDPSAALSTTRLIGAKSRFAGEELSTQIEAALSGG